MSALSRPTSDLDTDESDDDDDRAGSGRLGEGERRESESSGETLGDGQSQPPALKVSFQGERDGSTPTGQTADEPQSSRSMLSPQSNGQLKPPPPLQSRRSASEGSYSSGTGSTWSAQKYVQALGADPQADRIVETDRPLLPCAGNRLFYEESWAASLRRPLAALNTRAQATARPRSPRSIRPVPSRPSALNHPSERLPSHRASSPLLCGRRTTLASTSGCTRRASVRRRGVSTSSSSPKRSTRRPRRHPQTASSPS